MLNKICVNERYKVCKDIFDIFESNNIPYAVIKGAVLSKMAYGDIYYRKSGDIDILINRKDIDIVKQIMIGNDFIQGHVTNGEFVHFRRRELLFQTAMSHQMAPFIKQTSNPLCPYVNVDINFDIIWSESELEIDMDYVLSHIQMMEIYNTNIKKLPPEMEFVALCLHHYKDMNSIYLLSHGSLKLSLFEDIYNYLKKVSLDKSTLQEICNHLNVTEYVNYCIYYTNEVFNDSLLNEFLSLLHTDKVESILHTYGLADEEIKEWEVSFHDRLYNVDINDYFNTNLSEKNLEKIKLNNLFM